MSVDNSQGLTANMILTRLQQRVSKGNAQLLFDTAKIQSGFKFDDQEAVLDKETAKNLCLVLIKQGGPSFQVGQSLYKEYLM